LTMDKISFNVKKDMCSECAMALRRFIGHMDGVEEVGVEGGKLVINFDGARIDEAELIKLSRDSVEKLGYDLKD